MNRTEMFFIKETIGPFRANESMEMPLWLAIQLKKRKLIRIVLPPWLSVRYLSQIYQAEKSNDSTFEVLPYYYSEMATILLKECKDEFQEDDDIRVNGQNNQGEEGNIDNSNGNGNSRIERKVVDVRQKIKVLLEDILQLRDGPAARKRTEQLL